MKVLVVGSYNVGVYAEAIADGFEALGVEVARFGWSNYFSSPADGKGARSNILRLSLRFQNKYLLGRTFHRMNRDLLLQSLSFMPDVIFYYCSSHISPSTVRAISEKTGCFSVAYNNDDPFSKCCSIQYWRHYFGSLQFMDLIYAYRQKNIVDYQNCGYSGVKLLMPYYRKKFNYIDTSIEDYDLKQVVFIGHYENDKRDEFVKALFENVPSFQLYGTGWQHSMYYDYFMEQMDGSITPVYDEQYNEVLNESLIAIAFLSKLNNDQYTRRCFEIPATQTLLLCERTNAMQSLLKEGIEADYFSSVSELIEKVGFYLDNVNIALSISKKGYKAIQKHEVKNRCQQVLDDVFAATSAT